MGLQKLQLQHHQYYQHHHQPHIHLHQLVPMLHLSIIICFNFTILWDEDQSLDQKLLEKLRFVLKNCFGFFEVRPTTTYFHLCKIHSEKNIQLSRVNWNKKRKLISLQPVLLRPPRVIFYYNYFLMHHHRQDIFFARAELMHNSSWCDVSLSSVSSSPICPKKKKLSLTARLSISK